jgi:hypothetical protein
VAVAAAAGVLTVAVRGGEVECEVPGLTCSKGVSQTLDGVGSDVDERGEMDGEDESEQETGEATRGVGGSNASTSIPGRRAEVGA